MPVPRPSTASSCIPRPSWNKPLHKINSNKEEPCKTLQVLRARPSTAHASAGPRTCNPKGSQDLVAVRSRYCLTEDARKARARTKSPPKKERPAADGRGCDVTFLKKLLAMNKKQEMVINMKLVELMKERGSDDRGSDKKKPVKSSSVIETQSGGRSSTWQPARRREDEYDLNGRRVCPLSDLSEEENDETWIANTTTTTVVERTEAAERQTMTVRSASRTERGHKGETLVVHCVAPDDAKARAKKRLLKVWNYKSLLNSGEGGEGDGDK